MADWARARLVAAAAFLLLSLLPWPAQAGTQEDPEFTDDAGDPDVSGVPFGQLFLVSDGVDLLNGWVEENATTLVLALELAGETELFDPLTSYNFDFHLSAGGSDHVASAAWSGSFEPGGVATAVVAEGTVLRFIVPKTAVGAFLGDTIDGLYAESSGTLVTDPLSSLLDRAPDEGVGRSYNVTQGVARGGSATDTDGDGLLDSKEVTYFGNITKQNGTGDPDDDGLNNTAEFDLGTDPTKMDTDGDFLDDGKDPFPLDPSKPADADGDGLTDSWERTHFTSLESQDGDGDPDRDTLNNTKELALGTDPNKADTDGDGATDDADADPLDPAVGDDDDGEGGAREPKPELYGGAAMFAAAATFILLALAKGI